MVFYGPSITMVILGAYACLNHQAVLWKRKDLMGIKKIMKKWNGPFYDNEGSDNPSHRGDWQHLRYSLVEYGEKIKYLKM